MTYNTAELITQVREGAMLSAGSANLTDAQILSLANRAVTQFIVPAIKRANDEYLIYEDSFELVSGKAKYPIPYRSAANQVRHLYMVCADGSLKTLNRYKPEDKDRLFADAKPGEPTGFYVSGQSLTFLGTPNAVRTIQISYPFRPNKLVTTTQTATITDISEGGTVTLSQIPTDVNGNPLFATGLKYDIVRETSGNEIVYFDLVGTLTGDELEFDTETPELEEGMIVSLAKQSSALMMPEEFQDFLVEATILRLEAMRGTEARLKIMERLLQDLRVQFDLLLQPRFQSKPPVAGGPSPFLGNRRGFR